MTTDANGGQQNGGTASGAGPGGDQGQQQQQAPWFSSIDFGDAKESATAALSSFKTPQELVGALDWRKNMSGGDETAVKFFERYATPADAGKAMREAQKKISSGELAKPLPKDATPEQVAEWRKGNGIPDKPEGYFEKLPNGLVIGADDKPMFDAVAQKLHARNVPPEVIHDLAEWYYGSQNENIQAQQAADAAAKPALEAALRETWGADFKANANVYASYLEAAPKEVQDVLKSARDAEGNFILYRPEVVSWLVAQAREINPAGHITPAGNEGTVQSVQAEIDTIEAFMRTNRTAYNKDEKMQARARQLYAARAKLQERGRAA